MSWEDSIGEGWLSALHPDDLSGTIKQWLACLKSGKPLDVEYRLRLKDGDYRWIRARAFPRRNDAGDIVQWIWHAGGRPPSPVWPRTGCSVRRMKTKN